MTEKLLACVDAANICCGVHSGSIAKTQRTLRSAVRRGVLIGAHPGMAAAGGRGSELPGLEAFQSLLSKQISDFIRLTERSGACCSYVKLHGSLYHAIEKHKVYAVAYLNVLKQTSGLRFEVFASAGGSFQRRARVAGLKVREEIFADRSYSKDGSLVSRSEPNAILPYNTALVRMEHWLRTGEMGTVDETAIRLRADTICVHGDSPDADKMLAGLRKLLRKFS